MIYDGIMTVHPPLGVPRMVQLHNNNLFADGERRDSPPNLDAMVERLDPILKGPGDAFGCNMEKYFFDDSWLPNPAAPDSYDAMRARVLRGDVAGALQAATDKPVWVYGGVAQLGVNLLDGGIDKVMKNWTSVVHRAYIQRVGSWVAQGYYKHASMGVWMGNLLTQLRHARKEHGVETVVYVSPYAAGKTDLQERSQWLEQFLFANTFADNVVIWTGEDDVSWDECGEHVEAALAAVDHGTSLAEAA